MNTISVFVEFPIPMRGNEAKHVGFLLGDSRSFQSP